MSSFLDITFLIQILHFILAYRILVHFFLRPAYIHYMHVQRERKRMNDFIKSEEHLLMLQRKEKSSECAIMQNAILIKLPINEYKKEMAQKQSRSMVLNLSDAEKNDLAYIVAQQLTERIINE